MQDANSNEGNTAAATISIPELDTTTNYHDGFFIDDSDLAPFFQALGEERTTAAELGEMAASATEPAEATTSTDDDWGNYIDTKELDDTSQLPPYGSGSGKPASYCLAMQSDSAVRGRGRCRKQRQPIVRGGVHSRGRGDSAAGAGGSGGAGGDGGEGDPVAENADPSGTNVGSPRDAGGGGGGGGGGGRGRGVSGRRGIDARVSRGRGSGGGGKGKTVAAPKKTVASSKSAKKTLFHLLADKQPIATTTTTTSDSVPTTTATTTAAAAAAATSIGNEESKENVVVRHEQHQRHGDWGNWGEPTPASTLATEAMSRIYGITTPVDYKTLADSSSASSTLTAMPSPSRLLGGIELEMLSRNQPKTTTKPRDVLEESVRAIEEDVHVPTALEATTATTRPRSGRGKKTKEERIVAAMTAEGRAASELTRMDVEEQRIIEAPPAQKELMQRLEGRRRTPQHWLQTPPPPPPPAPPEPPPPFIPRVSRYVENDTSGGPVRDIYPAIRKRRRRRSLPGHRFYFSRKRDYYAQFRKVRLRRPSSFLALPRARAKTVWKLVLVRNYKDRFGVPREHTIDLRLMDAPGLQQVLGVLQDNFLPGGEEREEEEEETDEDDDSDRDDDDRNEENQDNRQRMERETRQMLVVEENPKRNPTANRRYAQPDA